METVRGRDVCFFFLPFFSRRNILAKGINIIFRLMSLRREYEELSLHMETNPRLKGRVTVNYVKLLLSQSATV